MSTNDVLATARQIADAAGVEHHDLVELPPQQQIAAIRDRLSRKIIATREEMIGLRLDRLRSKQRIAA